MVGVGGESQTLQNALGQEESIQPTLSLPQLEEQGGVARGHCKILFFLAPSEENWILVIGCFVSHVTSEGLLGFPRPEWQSAKQME